MHTQKSAAQAENEINSTVTPVLGVKKVKTFDHYRKILGKLNPELVFTEDTPTSLSATSTAKKPGYRDPLRIGVSIRDTGNGLVIDFQNIYKLEENRTNIDFYFDSFLTAHKTLHKVKK